MIPHIVYLHGFCPARPPSKRRRWLTIWRRKAPWAIFGAHPAGGARRRHPHRRGGADGVYRRTRVAGGQLCWAVLCHLAGAKWNAPAVVINLAVRPICRCNATLACKTHYVTGEQVLVRPEYFEQLGRYRVSAPTRIVLAAVRPG